MIFPSHSTQNNLSNWNTPPVSSTYFHSTRFKKFSSCAVFVSPTPCVYCWRHTPSVYTLKQSGYHPIISCIYHVIETNFRLQVVNYSKSLGEPPRYEFLSFFRYFNINQRSMFDWPHLQSVAPFLHPEPTNITHYFIPFLSLFFVTKFRMESVTPSTRRRVTQTPAPCRKGNKFFPSILHFWRARNQNLQRCACCLAMSVCSTEGAENNISEYRHTFSASLLATGWLHKMERRR